MEIPKPDYTEVRRNIGQAEEVLDPRLRRILSLKEGDSTKGNEVTLQSPDHQIDDGVNITIESNVSSSVAVAPRLDPRRKFMEDNKVIDQQNVAQSVTSANLDIQCVLRKSDWYKDLSSKQKIMVNQQLALVSTELKKYHQDKCPDKIFNLSFVIQNPMLQQVLTNLGIYIDEDGQFVELNNQSSSDFMNNVGCNNLNLMNQNDSMHGVGGIDIGGSGINASSMEFGGINRPQRIGVGNNGMMPTNRFMGLPMMYPPGGSTRPGLLGVAPGIPYNMYDNQQTDEGVSGNNNFTQQQQYDEYGNPMQMYDQSMGGNNFDGPPNFSQNSGMFDSPSDGNSGGMFFGGNNNRGNRDSAGGGRYNNNNFRGGPNRPNNMDRWSGSGAPIRGGNIGISNNNNNGGPRSTGRRNHFNDNRERNRRDKSNNKK